MNEDVNIIISATDRASRAFKDIGKTGKTTFTELRSALDLASMAFNKVLQVGKKVFDMGKQGAQLEYTSQKFANLSRSIGEVSDALLIDLRAATQGLVSDSQLIQSATDFMSLGLANTREEVIRLTKVAGALNMDMNQLVLTLTNQTTMRFDALGVSVAGFDERVKALEKTGMSASDAFNEAFLRQAEEQIELVGDAADGAAGDFLRMDAAVANMSDTLKRKAAPAVTAFASLVADMLTLDAERWFKDGSNAAAGFLNTLFGWDDIEFDITKSLRSTNRESREREAILNAGVQVVATSIKWEEDYSAALAITADQYLRTREAAARASDYVGQFRDGISGSISALDRLNNMELNFGSTIKTQIDKIEWEQLGGGAIQRAFEQVNQAIEDGKISPADAKAAFAELYVAAEGVQADIDDINVNELAQKIQDEIGGSFEAARAKAEEIKATLKAGTMEDYTYNIILKYSVVGDTGKAGTGNYVPNITLPQGSPKAAGGFVQGGVSYPVGERGVEMFTPATNGYITPNNQLSGGVINNYFTVNTLPGQDAPQIAAHLFNMMNRGSMRGRAGIGYAGA